MSKPESQRAKGIAGGIGMNNDGVLNVVTDPTKKADLQSRFDRGEIKIVPDVDDKDSPKK